MATLNSFSVCKVYFSLLSLPVSLRLAFLRLVMMLREVQVLGIKWRVCVCAYVCWRFHFLSESRETVNLAIHAAKGKRGYEKNAR